VKFSLQKLALAVTLLLVSTQSVFAQNYPLPGKQGQAPVTCNGCTSTNPSGQLNDGLKTWPYASPIVNHTGRFLDANFIANFQFSPRTLRARRIRLARQQRGSAPPRAYIQLGSSIGVYSLDKFFTNTLPAGMVSVQTLASSAKRPGYTPEKLARWDAYVDPETNSSWNTPTADGQDRLFDFDVDDRGYLYVAAGFFGWGIVKDNGETNASQLTLVKQTLIDEPYCVTSSVCFPAIADPRMIVAFKSGSRYYVAVSDDNGRPGRRIWDVTDPTHPVTSVQLFKSGSVYSILSWAKDDAHSRIAIVTGDKKVEVYDNATFATGGAPLQTFTPASGKKYRDVTADENGNFWTTEATAAVTTNRLIKIERTGSGYTDHSYDVYGGAFAPKEQQTEGYNTIEYGDKYLSIVGRSATGVDVRLFRVDSGEPVAVPLNEFFKNYYWVPPSNYAMPQGCPTSFGTYPIKWGNKVYLLQSTNGLGDVFELQAGDSISGALKSGTFGTVNPHSKPTETGPFYADPLKFRAESSNPLSAYTVLWNFDNTDSGSANEATSRTGEDVEHQFTGLNTVTKIAQVRQVKVTAPISSDMNDTINVTLKVPVARMGVAGTSVATTVDSSTLDLIAGDSLSDASDGTVESHFATWTIDAVPTKQQPNEIISAGGVGAHTATLAASYGKYDGAFNTTGTAYVDTVSNVSYTVRPFLVAFSTPTTSGTAVTFKGTARKTSLTNVLSAVNWTVEWSLKNGSTDVVPPTSTSVPVGQIPNFPVADKSAIPSGSILKLKVIVDPLGLSAEAANYASHEVSQTLITPDPKITKTGCLNANDACSFTAGSVAGNPIGGWAIVWTLKKNGTTIDTFTGNPYAPSITEAGSYTVSVLATTSVFDGTAALPAFTVAAPLCTNPPTVFQMSIFTSCNGVCDVNEDVTIQADPFQYVFEDCEQFVWAFGDGQTATTTTRTTKHKYTTKGNKTVRLTVKKGTQSSPEFTATINIGGDDDPPPPPPTCTFPSGINFSYSGNKGCGPNKNCKTGESVTFTGSRGSGALSSCDTAHWTFHNSTSVLKTPSKTYSSPGTYDVTLLVTNSAGDSQPVTKTLTIVQDDTVGECTAPSEAKIIVTFRGRTSHCTEAVGSAPCTAGEIIDFESGLFPLNNPQSCDRFEWNYGDGSSLVTAQTSTHTFASNGTYQASLRWYNTANSTGITIPLTVPVGNSAPIKPTPTLAFSQFPASGAKGNPVTFTVNVTNPAADNVKGTGWSWDFGDGTKDSTSQASVVGTTTSIQHTFTKTGTFSVSVKARNSESASNAPTGQAVSIPGIVITDIPEYKYLLPVVTHSGGQNNSVWRTDVQIYTPDPSVTTAHPLEMEATLRDLHRNLTVFSSTFTYEDFMRVFTNGTDSGPVIITVRSQFAPQIWTRTYNQTDLGTFGQYIPAIRIDAAAGAASAFGEGKYYMAGLRHDSHFRTNLGFLNPNAQTINALVKVFDDQQQQVGQFTVQLPQYQLKQFPITAPEAVPGLSPDRPFSVEISVPPGQWLIGYASYIDNASGDPMTLSAVRESELGLTDYSNIVIPGVGHVGEWRSDVTIFNPDSKSVVLDLAYHDSTGAKVAEAKSVLIRQGEFIQYKDLIKQGILGSLPDSLGILRVNVVSPFPPTTYPLTFARTYNDKGTGKTFGQGIGGFAVGRANVKPGKPALVAGIRSNSKYYTNVGLTNVSNVSVTATVKLLDPTSGAEQTIQTHTLQPNQSVVARVVMPSGLETGSLKLEVSGGNVWAFGSIVDVGTADPEYVAATPLVQQ
jgi:PKD repeat protein